MAMTLKSMATRLRSGIGRLASRLWSRFKAPVYGIATLGRFTGYSALIASLALCFLTTGTLDLAEFRQLVPEPEKTVAVAEAESAQTTGQPAETDSPAGDNTVSQTFDLDSVLVEATRQLWSGLAMSLSETIRQAYDWLPDGILPMLVRDPEEGKPGLNLAAAFTSGDSVIGAITRAGEHVPGGLLLLMASAWLQRRTKAS